MFTAAKREFVDAVQKNGRLPAQVYLGSYSLSLADFAATAAATLLAPDTEIALRHGNLVFEHYVSGDPVGPFKWGIHPVGFSAPRLLELTRLQAWTLKPAKLRR
jgi:hypothetical protein